MHKVFTSFYHQDDEFYKNKFIQLIEDLIINKSVKSGDINTDISTEYIKRLIQQEYISDSSVVVVLVGPKTYCRKHVDWEISAGLNKKVGGYSGLLGICLPTHPSFRSSSYSSSTVPSRLVDNLKTGYASLYDWTEDRSHILNWIQSSFNSRVTKNHLIDNSRPQLGRNLCD